MAASWPLLISRYTVMFETRIVAATSPTVSSRSPTSGRFLPMYLRLSLLPLAPQLPHSQHLAQAPLLPPLFRGDRKLTRASFGVNPPVSLHSARQAQLHR